MFYKTCSFKLWSIILTALLVCTAGLLAGANPASAQQSRLQGEDTATATATETQTATTPAPTETGTATATQTPTVTPQPIFARPVLVVTSYSVNKDKINPGDQFEITVRLKNNGNAFATNIILSFAGGDFFPRQTGGVIAVKELDPDEYTDIVQPLTVDTGVWGKTIGMQDVNITYTDITGASYQEKFSLSIPLNVPTYVVKTSTPTPTSSPTPTAGPVHQAQLVITRYETDISPLQPGLQFQIKLEVSNLGNANANRVTMLVGGVGSAAAGGTPDASGISGASGEFTNFAPLGASNVQSLGNIPAGSKLEASQALIVNVSTNPGAYPMKVSFIYLNEKGAQVVDEQVITLLVYSLPLVEVNFYRDPGILFVGQPNMLPIQVTNLGRKTALLGNLKVSAPGGDLQNNVMLIGALEAGGYYTLDAVFVPMQAGQVEVKVVIDYTDDFNQPRQIVVALPVDVQEMLMPDESGVNGNGEVQPEAPVEQTETFWQKVWRFVLGLLGLDSGKPATDTVPVDVEMPITDPSGKPLKGP